MDDSSRRPLLPLAIAIPMPLVVYGIAALFTVAPIYVLVAALGSSYTIWPNESHELRLFLVLLVVLTGSFLIRGISSAWQQQATARSLRPDEFGTAGWWPADRPIAPDQLSGIDDELTRMSWALAADPATLDPQSLALRKAIENKSAVLKAASAEIVPELTTRTRLNRLSRRW